MPPAYHPARCRHPRSLRGFTLIEILVVVMILAVLIALLLPSLGRARHAAVRVKCAVNLKHMHQAFSMFGQDHAGRLPENPVEYQADMLWLSVPTRDVLVNQYGLVQNIFDCPAIVVCPRTDDWRPGYGIHWNNPYVWSGGIRAVPTGYILWAGRSHAYYGPITVSDSIPVRLEDRKRMLGGTTLTPWFNDYHAANPGFSWSVPFPDIDNPLHWNRGGNAALPDGSVIFKPLRVPQIVDPLGEPSLLKYYAAVNGAHWAY